MDQVQTAKRSGGDLSKRLISAAILIPFGLFMVWVGGAALAASCSLFAALMAYEWVRMSESPLMKILVFLAIIPSTIAGLLGAPAGVLALIVCSVIAALAHPLAKERLMSGFGLFYAAGMPLALFALRDGHWQGAAATLIIGGIVVGSDSAAYFAGRGFGGPQLSPDSPSKTWSGAIGALIFCGLCGLLAARITGGDQIAWVATGVLISVLAQLGDLFESSLKRRYGVKDASGLLPGHGGFMDRVDGLGATATIAALAFSLSAPVVQTLGLQV